jgi:hypothetical protein
LEVNVIETMLAATLAATLAAAPNVPNPIVDPGFEIEGAAGALSAWKDCGTTPATLESTGVRSGRFAVLLNGDAAICQRVKVPMAASVLLDYWAKATAPTGADKSAIYQEVSLYDPLTPDGKPELVQTIVHDATTTRDFAHYTFDITAYAGQTLLVRFGVHGGTATAPISLVVDDVSIVSQYPMGNRS